MADALSNILVIQVARIGDTLFATPALRAIAAAYPDANITVAGHPKRAEVFEHLPFVHRVTTITKNRAPWLGRFAKKSYDLAFVFGFDEPLVTYALRVSERVVAFEQQDAALNKRLFAAVPPPPFQSEHAVRQMLRLPAAVGIAPAGLRIAYTVAADEVDAARRRLDQAGIHGNDLLVGLQVASFPTKAYRDWPIAHFAELCERMAARWPQIRFAIFGGTQEMDRTAWLGKRLGSRATIFAGQLTLRETAALMSLTDLYIGVDTGPTHMMSAFDIPMIGLYHPLSPSTLTGPLDHPMCQAIDLADSGDNTPEVASMAEVSVDRVFTCVERILNKRAGQET